MDDRDLKKYELIKKLKAMVDRGTEEERKTAKKKIDLLIEKYNLDLNDCNLDYEVYSRHPFYYKGKYEKSILVQVFAMITKGDDKVHIYHGLTETCKRSSNRLVAVCTESQAIEIKIAYEFYLELFYEDLDLFLMAFISKHNLFGNPTSDEEEDYRNDYTKEQLFRMSLFATGLKNGGSPVQRIEDKSEE